MKFISKIGIMLLILSPCLCLKLNHSNLIQLLRANHINQYRLTQSIPLRIYSLPSRIFSNEINYMNDKTCIYLLDPVEKILKLNHDIFQYRAQRHRSCCNVRVEGFGLPL